MYRLSNREILDTANVFVGHPTSCPALALHYILYPCSSPPPWPIFPLRPRPCSCLYSRSSKPMSILYRPLIICSGECDFLTIFRPLFSVPVVMLEFGLGKGEEAENSSVRPPRRTHYSDDNWTGFAHPLAICATPLRLIYLPMRGSRTTSIECPVISDS